MQGYIKLNRSIQEHWIWNNYPFSEGQAWVDLIMLANHEDVKIPYKKEIITCERGTVNRSILSLAERWKWSRKKTQDFLRLLEKDNMILINATTHRTTITLVNYDNFQLQGTTKDTTNDTTKEQQGYQQGIQQGIQQGSTNKNDNNDKNDKNEKNDKNNKEILPKGNIKKVGASEAVVYYPNDEELNIAFKDFVDMRKKIKKPLTDRAIDLAIKKLNELSDNDNVLAIKIIEQSVMNSWQSFYPLKETNETKQKGYDWANL